MSIRSRSLPILVFMAGLYAGVGVVKAQPTTQPFTFSVVAHDMPGIRQGAAVWGDYDLDGDLDLLLSGLGLEEPVTGLYRNDGRPDAGSAAFTPVQALKTALYGAAAWGDYDGDGDLDLVVQGSTTVDPPYVAATTLYRNDAGTLVDVEAGLPGLHSGAVAWGDYDLDGDLDLLFTGEEAPERYRTMLYRNEGAGRFAEVETGFPGMGYSDAAWGDYDGDGDLDLVLAGTSEQGFLTAVYRNGRAQGFERTADDLVDVAFSTVAWGDYDGDADLDLLVSGGQFGLSLLDGRTRLYRNAGGRLDLTDVTLPQTLAGDATWGDYDDDGDLDLLVMGLASALGERATELYENDGRGVFTRRALLHGAGFASADWGDYDGDGDLDLLATGWRPGGPAMNLLYDNVRLAVRPPPPPPGKLAADVAAGRASLAWDVPSLAPDATFNVRVGTTPGASDVVAPMADARTGRRHLAAPGNAGRLTRRTLENLAPGTYYWSVQALNGAFAPSAFATEGSFTVTGGATVGTDASEVPARFAAYPNYPNPFDRATTLQYDLPRAAPVVLTVYNVLGEVVWQERHAQQPAGTHRLVWDGCDRVGQPVGAGLYLYELRAGSTAANGTMVRLK